jgi:hypothetical protein
MGESSRVTWLPVLGTSAWLVWGAIAESINAGKGEARWSLEALGGRWGYAAEEVSWCLARLASFGLAQPTGPAAWHVRATCPPPPFALRRHGPKASRRPSWASRHGRAHLQLV